MAAKNIAILGGGLTGLSSAFHLSRRFPDALITLHERSTRLGGWVRSERIDIPNSTSSILLESGPRSLRPNAKSVLELINLLNLKESVVSVPKTAPAAKSRFLYIPKSNGESPTITGLQPIPSSFSSLLSSPLKQVLILGVLRDALRWNNRTTTSHDESVHSFLTRHFGEKFACIFGSALVHGIYAGDSRKLSLRAAFPSVWEAEEKGYGSVIRGFLMSRKQDNLRNDEDYDLGQVPDMMRDVSVFSFRDGMETLTRAMEDHLKRFPNVQLLKGSSVSSLKVGDDKTIELSIGTPRSSYNPSHVVSALPLTILHNLLHSQSSPKPSSLPNLTVNPSSTVHVINLVFPGPPASIHPAGFGYLIPRPVSDYPSSAAVPYDSSGFLGTVFDSCSLHEQDRPDTAEYFTDAKYTKLTVMMGGPYPMKPLQTSFGHSHDVPLYIRDVLQTLMVHLEKHLPDPVYWRVQKNDDCIPTMLSGHQERIQEMKKVLRDPSGWDGKLEVIGAGVGGVSVGDCIEAGRRVGRDWQ